MALTDLTQLQLLEGIFGLIWVIIAIFIGFRVIWKAIILDRTKDLITVGLSYVLVSSAWWGVALQFITYGFFNFKIDEFTYLLIANVFIPPALICWIYSFGEITGLGSKKRLLIIYIVFCSIWEIFVLSAAFINISLVGSLNGLFDSSHSSILLIIILIAIATFLITGIIFALKSMRLDDPEIQWKGKFLLIAWISFGVGALLDASLPLNPITLIVVRIILISSAIEFYFGFFLPKSISSRLK